ncbi:exopolysaccharide biosynthesis polyprenyl glycosylphosphotransferase [Candidatus Parcubacteria bacterium]|nr:MAG: exopolysaccharide biosynthesis polyprenyl glycosylphosphotransferase [Candidatus Parcubacteria bacterium]
MRRSLSPATLLILVGDIAVFLAAITITLVIRHGGAPDASIVELYRFAAPFLIALWAAGFTIFGLYDIRFVKNDPQFFDRLLRAVLFNGAVTAFFFYAIPRFGLRPLGSLVILTGVLAVLTLGWRGLANIILAQQRKDRILWIGITPDVLAIVRFLRANPQLGFAPAAFLRMHGEDDLRLHATSFSEPVFPAEHPLTDIVARERITHIVLSPAVQQSATLAKALFRVVPLGVTVMEFDKFYELVEGKIPVAHINEAWFFENLIGQRRPRYEFGKRILDLGFAVPWGIAMLILFAPIALGIVLSTPRDIRSWRARRARPGDGIIFFRQRRVGRDGRVFQFVKFRSQRLGAERYGSEKFAGSPPAGRAGHDPRTYPFGTFLRKTYLDELPQVWNVLKGDMSFVGPRPERPEFVRELERTIPFYRTRELVLPGITGWAQINMENDASVSDAPEKLQYDLYYIKNRSLALDLNILLKTALALLRRSGR